ncbi:MAG: GTP-binding protein [Lutibacter sp.]
MEVFKNSDVFLRPRFKIIVNENRERVLSKFKQQDFKRVLVKIIDYHIVIDVLQKETHFWSPQLHVEVEKLNENESVIRGLFGPKPHVWTLFMFIHFVMAFAFIGFAIITYVKWVLKSNIQFYMIGLCAVPVLWIVMYFLGRLGKRKGENQMKMLQTMLISVLEK